MKKSKECSGVIAVGPDGTILSAATLPRSANIKWVKRRKAEVVIAVDRGIISLQEACRRYAMSEEEFFSWKLEHERGGIGASKRPAQKVARPPRVAEDAPAMKEARLCEIA